MRLKYSTDLANRLRDRLFTRSRRDHKVRYDPRDDASEDAAWKTWSVHGVCLECRCRTITAGRCPECDIDYSPHRLGSGNSEALAQLHLEEAFRFLKESP